MDRRLVDHFVNSDLISRAGMQRFILRATKNKSGVIEEILEDGSLDEQTLARGLAECYGYEVLPEIAIEADPKALNLITGKMARNHGVLPFKLSDDGNEVTVAVYDTESAGEVLKTLKMATGNPAEIRVATRSYLHDAIGHYYFDETWELKEAADEDAPEFQLERIEESDEILLEDVADDFEEVDELAEEVDIPVADVASTARSKAPAKRPETRKKPLARVIPEKKAFEPPKRSSSKPPKAKNRKKQDSVEQALEDFDAFLDQSDYASGAPALTADPTPEKPQWDADDHMAAQSGFGSDDSFDAAEMKDDSDKGFDEDAFADAFTTGDDSNGGFDLFEPSEVQMSAEEIIIRNEKRIQNLKRELKGQREVVSSLVDLLVESRVISRKELMQRVNEKRNS